MRDRKMVKSNIQPGDYVFINHDGLLHRCKPDFPSAFVITQRLRRSDVVELDMRGEVPRFIQRVPRSNGTFKDHPYRSGEWKIDNEKEESL